MPSSDLMDTRKVSHAGLLLVDVATELISLGRCKLAGGDLVLKENIKLAEGTSLGLGKTEEGVDDEDGKVACPEETARKPKDISFSLSKAKCLRLTSLHPSSRPPG